MPRTETKVKIRVRFWLNTMGLFVIFLQKMYNSEVQKVYFDESHENDDVGDEVSRRPKAVSFSHERATSLTISH